MYSASFPSPLGLIDIRCSDAFVHSISFSSEESLEKSTDVDHPVLKTVLQQLQEYFEGKRKIFDLPLQQQGTEFQQRVWNQLLQIPFGKTISYLELARKIGDVKAIRAVGTANGKNNLAIVVPCHRVIGTNTRLTGYAGGLWRKQWLLEHEAKYEAGVQLLNFQ